MSQDVSYPSSTTRYLVHRDAAFLQTAFPTLAPRRVTWHRAESSATSWKLSHSMACCGCTLIATAENFFPLSSVQCEPIYERVSGLSSRHGQTTAEIWTGISWAVTLVLFIIPQFLKVEIAAHSPGGKCCCLFRFCSSLLGVRASSGESRQCGWLEPKRAGWALHTHTAKLGREGSFFQLVCCKEGLTVVSYFKKHLAGLIVVCMSRNVPFFLQTME